MHPAQVWPVPVVVTAVEDVMRAERANKKDFFQNMLIRPCCHFSCMTKSEVKQIGFPRLMSSTALYSGRMPS